MFEMKHLVFLSLVLTCILTGKAQAESDITASGFCNDTETCLWNLDSSGKMTISAATGATDVVMKDYICDNINCSSRAGNRPWEEYMQQIKNLVVEDNIITIGKDAFQDAHNLQTVTGMKDVKNINEDAFARTVSLTSIELPNVEKIKGQAFYYATKLESVDLPNVKSIKEEVFWGTSSLEFAGIPEGVAFGINVFKGSKISNCQNTGECGSCGDKFVQAGAGCVDKCYKDYMPCSGYCCLRTRYTLPEADEATSNDNENTIEWIFE